MLKKFQVMLYLLIITVASLSAINNDRDMDGKADHLTTFDYTTTYRDGPRDISVALIEAGHFVEPFERLLSLGFMPTTIPADSPLEIMQQYDVIYLTTSWAKVPEMYRAIEENANTYLSYVKSGGGLFIEQPNPKGEARPSIVPYPLTISPSYDLNDAPLIIVDPTHEITSGLPAEDLPYPYDTITELDNNYTVLVTGGTTKVPSLITAEYEQGRILIHTGHASLNINHPFSNEVYTRMITWTGTKMHFPATVTISPPGGLYAGTQKFDITLIVKTDSTVSGAKITFNNNDVTNIFLSGIKVGTLKNTKGITIRYPGLSGAFMGEGIYEFKVALSLEDGRTINDTVNWEIIGNTE